MKQFPILLIAGLLPFSAVAADLVQDTNTVEIGPPAAGTTFLLEGYGGYNWIDSNAFDDPDEKDQYWMYGGWAGVNIPVGTTHGLQLEIFGESTPNVSIDQDNYAYSGGGGVHVFWRDPGSGLIGVMGGVFISDAGVDADLADEDTGTAWLAGIEAQAYLGRTTLFGQFGYATYVDSPADGDDDTGSDPDFPKDTVFVRGVARRFLTDYTKLEGEVGGAFGKFSANNSSFSLVNWALEIEQAFVETMPVTVFARYEGIYADWSSEGAHSLDSTIKIGLRARFGGAAQSPYFSDRHGVSLDLPDVGRWGGVLNGPIQ